MSYRDAKWDLFWGWEGKFDGRLRLTLAPKLQRRGTA
jgi:hypothetical protein